jgi:hypothetical protein
VQSGSPEEVSQLSNSVVCSIRVWVKDHSNIKATLNLRLQEPKRFTPLSLREISSDGITEASHRGQHNAREVKPVRTYNYR